ncbi:MAG: restriction endonuclease [Tepidisphaeraceae bacterium]
MSKRRKDSDKSFVDFISPIIAALRALGGSARPSEVKTWIMDHVELDEAFLAITNKSGETRFSNRVDWARFYLVRAGWLDSSKRGVWSLTEKGRSIEVTADAAEQIVRSVRATAADDPTPTPEMQIVRDVEEDAPADVGTYRGQTLRLLLDLPPDGFERFCQRILRESGFEEVEVTGKSHDGGIDGRGILKLNAFVSFSVEFQCKRWKSAVGSAEIRNFRGSLDGSTDKGIIITTSAFTREAEKEASSPGKQPIELVDGESLVDLLEELKLGLTPVQTFEVDDEFFNEFR